MSRPSTPKWKLTLKLAELADFKATVIFSDLKGDA